MSNRNQNGVNNFQYVHGMSKTTEYTIWDSMKRRCFNPNDTAFEYYGARGITVCERWKNSFKAFYQDVGARPSKKHSLDRIDNNGHYEPGNVRWVSGLTQFRNRRKPKSNKSGFVGVNWYKRTEKWQSYITIQGEFIYLGYFKTPEEAAIARDEYILENELADFPLQILPEPD